MTPRYLLAVTFLAGLSGASIVSKAAAEDKVDFERQILPFWEKRCVDCHRAEYTDENGKVKKPKGGFRMDTAEETLKGGKEGDDIVPGKPDDSLVIKRVLLAADDDDAMPPKGERLSAEEIALLKKWIQEGASFGEWKGIPAK